MFKMIEQRKLLRLLKLISLLNSPRKRTVPELSEVLETSQQTIYRYLELLKEVGFDVRSDEWHQYYLASSKSHTQALLQLTHDEAQFLQSLVRSVSSPLQQSLLNKIYTGSALAESAYNIKKAQIGLCHQKLQQALNERKQVILVQYFSENSHDVSNRKVEPVRFIDEEMVLEAFDVKKKDIRHFKLDRMEDVRVLDTHLRHIPQHKQEPTDPFGVAGQAKVRIKLQLSLTGQRRLLEEFPGCASFLSTNGTGSYFEAEVNADFKLIDRFLLSYCDVIRIITPEALKMHMERKWDKNIL